MSKLKVGDYDIPRGIAARCPECFAWVHVKPRPGQPVTFADREVIERFWDRHEASCGWRP